MLHTGNRKIICVAGKTGYGKSYLVKTEIIPPLKRLVILDVMNEYDPAKCKYCYSIEDFRNEMSEHYNDTYFRYVLRLQDMESYEDAIAICMKVGNIWLLIEEASNFCSHNYINYELENILRFGRHKNLSLILITQRFQDLHLLARNNLDALIVFRLSAPNDIDYLSKIDYVGEKAYNVPNLQRYNYLEFINE